MLTTVLPNSGSIGHYKAEEWQESTKNYIVNDQLGIQIVVQVRSPSPSRPPWTRSQAELISGFGAASTTTTGSRLG